MTRADLPPVTQAQLQAAFVAMRWPGWSYAAAMADPMRSRLVRARAASMRTAQWMAEQRRTVVPVRRCRPGLDGHPMRWCTQMEPGPLEPRVQDDIFPT